jgi:hypothetical protein
MSKQPYRDKRDPYRVPSRFVPVRTGHVGTLAGHVPICPGHFCIAQAHLGYREMFTTHHSNGASLPTFQTISGKTEAL